MTQIIADGRTLPTDHTDPPTHPTNHRGTNTQRRSTMGEDRLGCQTLDAIGGPMTAPRAGVPSLTMLGAPPPGWGGPSDPNIV